VRSRMGPGTTAFEEHAPRQPRDLTPEKLLEHLRLPLERPSEAQLMAVGISDMEEALAPFRVNWSMMRLG